MGSTPVRLEDLVESRHPLPEWATFRELANGTGARASGRIDVAAFNVWPSKNGHRIAYEVKRTRSDWLRELSRPAKRAWCEDHFTECYAVAPAEVVLVEELPEGWGLLVPTRAGDKLRRVRVATQRRPGPLPETLAMAAMRRAAEEAHGARHTMVRIGSAELDADTVAARLEELVDAATAFRRKTLNTEIATARREAQTARDARALLEAPLAELRRAVTGRRPFVGDNDPVTVDDVREWIRAVYAGELEGFRSHVRALRRQCDLVLGDG